MSGWVFGNFEPVEMIFSYTVSDPFAVTLTSPLQPSTDEEIVWRFGRNLLAGGLYTCTGIGDVIVEPAEDANSITIELRNEDDEMKLLIPRSEMANFLDQTFARVPFGRESSFALPALNEFIASLYSSNNLPSRK